LATLAIGGGREAVTPITPVAWPRIRGYEILSVMGSGGMGIVYKARHRDLNRTVAVKMLRGSALEDPELRERFHAEAEAVAKLQHPNIIQVFEVGTVESTTSDWRFSPFISLEFVDGGSLESRTGTPQSPQFAARMVEKLARAAHAAHQVGVVHRDLKPANVLLTAAGEPKIADFGVAKQVANERTTTGRFVTQVGMAIGTPEYMAPEQVLCDTVTPAIDVYALGVMLYELLTARLPFQAPTPMETMELVINQDPVSPRLFQPNLPRDLETICLKCLQKMEDRRYASAEALADDLARWLGSKPIHARPIGRIARGARWVKRNPSVAALWALVATVAFAGVAGVTWKWREARVNEQSAKQAAEAADRKAAAERWNGYRANIIAASSAFEVHNDSAARRALEGSSEELRNWEWNYLHRRLDGSIRTIQAFTGRYENFRYSLNKRFVVKFNAGSASRFWDVFEQRQYASLVWGGGHAVDLSPDGNALAYSLDDKSIAVRDVRRDEIVATMKGHESPPVMLCYSADGTRLISGSHDGTVRVWNTSTGEQVYKVTGHRQPVGKAELSRDHRRLVTFGWQTKTAILWDGKTGKPIAALGGHEQDLAWANFNGKGDQVLTVEHYPSCQMRLWSAETGRLVAVLKGHEDQLTTHQFSPDDRRIITASRDQTIRLWDAKTGSLITTIRGHKGWVNDASFSPDGSRIASVSADHTVRIWNGYTGAPLAVLYGHANEIVHVSYQRDEIVSHALDGTVRYWDPKTVERDNRLLGHKNFVYGVVMHTDGKRVASASWDGTVRIWNFADGRELKSFSHGENVIVTALAYHPKGRLLVSLCREKGAHLWDTETGELLHRWDVAPEVWRDPKIAFSPDGNLFATASSDRIVRVFDVNTKAEVATLNGHTDVIRDLAFSPDGRYLATGGDRDDLHIRVWDLITKAQVNLFAGHTDRIHSLVFQADGKVLVSGSADGTVRLWDFATSKELAVLKHGTTVYGLAFSPDGTRLGCACADNSIRLWDVATKDQVAELRGHTNYVHALVFTPDGASIVSASGDRTLRVWNAK
jgi:WD40 repeat protein/tRNA A-37 threonylcarbamoyl transferase component Bud32